MSMGRSTVLDQRQVQWLGAVAVLGLGVASLLLNAPVDSTNVVDLARARGPPSIEKPLATATAALATDLKQLTVEMSNVYTQDGGGSPSVYYPWDYIAEPYKVTTFELVDEDLPDSSDSLDYRWILEGHLQGVGKSTQAVFTTIGNYTMTVEAFWPGVDADLATLLSTNITVVVKYVRREIRQLIDQDREAFFNAVSVLQRVPTRVGQRLYGSDYYSKDYLVRMHLYFGGTADCDHWHQGPGFVTSHMAYTLMFEKALQAVNPSVSVPYWDFTLESTFYEPATWRDSPVFSGDWFGEASPDNDLHTPNKGRFAYVPTMNNAREFSKVYNSYGLLRAPWNADPTPFMTRSKKVYGLDNNMKPSGCLEYAKVIRMGNWMDLARQLNSAAHGHIHETVGGSWNHAFGSKVNASDTIYSFAHQIQALSKDVWRAGYLLCADGCDPSLPASTCECECSEDSMQGQDPYDVLLNSGVLATALYFDTNGTLISSFVAEDGEVHYQLEGYTEEESAVIYQDLLTTLCNPGHIGDMFQATSSNDITFWVLHPTMDRLWHYVRLTNASSYNETWEDTATCYGHNPTDIQPFKGLFGDSDGSGRDYYTNAELYDALHPASDAMPYVYADFNWDHCTALGYRMKPVSE
eukprot:TRINITY_DN614_c0_g1_i2.p1 TRINITY_DN614_c0_g1~~TRINITY_DN614_c0_g1_i2.p1  ORF type:complete len:636 (-),score=156.71 TRINITY_DN614_c0_g1_i2:706-2613(-)